jgi:hypothetical protein
MRPLALAWLAACGTSAELGKPNDPPQWPLGTDLHPKVAPLVPEGPPDTDVAAGPDASAGPASEVTEPPAEEPVVPEPPEEQ